MVGQHRQDVKVCSFSVMEESKEVNDFVKAIFNEIRGEDPDYRPLLILVNPNSGRGAAQRRYEAEVAPFFKKINLVTEVLVTKRAGHAEEIGRTIDASKYRGVVTASGDGLLYEVLQGILSRKDDAIATIRKLKLGVLPLGSGNGLAASILKDANEPDITDLLASAFLIARGASRDIDIAAIETTKSTLYSFLCLEWALFADIDIESEWLRCCGPHGSHFGVCGVSCLRRSRNLQLSSFTCEDGGSKVKDVSIDMEEDSKSEEDTFTLIDRKVLPPLTSPVPSSWSTIDGEFTQFWAANTKLQSGDPLEMAPQADFDDGLMHVTINQSPSCCKMAELALFVFPEGKHSDDSGCINLKTRAFRLEPSLPCEHSHGGILAVDGESIPYGPIQLMVHKGLARIFAGKKV